MRSTSPLLSQSIHRWLFNSFPLECSVCEDVCLLIRLFVCPSFVKCTITIMYLEQTVEPKVPIFAHKIHSPANYHSNFQRSWSFSRSNIWIEYISKFSGALLFVGRIDYTNRQDVAKKGCQADLSVNSPSSQKAWRTISITSYQRCQVYAMWKLSLFGSVTVMQENTHD